MTKKKKLFLVVGMILVIIQFIPTHRNQSTELLDSDFILSNNVPEDIANKLRVSCYDCHSNNTMYPWYNKIQPISWFLENHIDEAKEELNFSEFGDYSNRRKKSKLKSIISQIEDGEMPLSSYTLMHGEANFTAKEKKQITEYMQRVKDKI